VVVVNGRLRRRIVFALDTRRQSVSSAEDGFMTIICLRTSSTVKFRRCTLCL
jgi:hypothetical protein